MTPIQLFSNNAVSLLNAPISASDTTLSLMTGHGDLYPTPGIDEYFLITLENQSATVREIIKVTGRSGDTLTGLVRGQEGTTAKSWTASSGADTLVDHRITAETLDKVNNKYNNSSFNTLTTLEKVADYLLQGHAVGGDTVTDGDFILSLVNNATQTVLTLPTNYKPLSAAVYVGGLRQKRNSDFLETSANEITLQFAHTQDLVNAGVNIVIDYVVA